MAFDSCITVTAPSTAGALALYSLARTSGAPAAYEAAAHALATALEAEQAMRRAAGALGLRAPTPAAPEAPKVSLPRRSAAKAAPAGPDLAARLAKPPRKHEAVAAFTVVWADGTATRVVSVTYDTRKPETRWAAAYQAADRLRRARSRHAFAESLDPSGGRYPLGILTGRFVTVGGVEREAADWLALVACRPMAPLAAISDEDTGASFDAPAGSAFGAGDAGAASALEAAICRPVLPWRGADDRRYGLPSHGDQRGLYRRRLPDAFESDSPFMWQDMHATGWPAYWREAMRRDAIAAFSGPDAAAYFGDVEAAPQTARPGETCEGRDLRDLDGCAVVIAPDIASRLERLAARITTEVQGLPNAPGRVQNAMSAWRGAARLLEGLGDASTAYTLRRRPGGTVFSLEAPGSFMTFDACRVSLLCLAARF